MMLLGTAGTGGQQLPFWATSNQFGLMPESSGAMALVQAEKPYEYGRTWQWHCGASLAANATAGTGSNDSKTLELSSLMVDEMYAGVRWKCLELDLGPKRRQLDFMASDPSLGSLSLTGGHVAESGNARTMPGYTGTLSPVAVPWTHDKLWLYGAYGDYTTIDTRYVQDALVHRTRLGLRYDITEKLAFHLMLDHYAIWGGHHPTKQDIKVNLENYLRVVTGHSAGEDGTDSDRFNVIGDQGGGELLRLEYHGDGWNVEFQHDIPYADGSGMGFQNFPDGINTIHFSWNHKNRWISDIVYEYHYTMYQSGTFQTEIFDENGNSLTPKGVSTTGGDNYFNNGYYRSGWTHFGRPIGTPLCFPDGSHAGTWTSDGITLGLESNRYQAHHLGLSGKLWTRHPYRLMLTWSRNHGTYGKTYIGPSQWNHKWGTVDEQGLWQFSAGYNGYIYLCSAGDTDCIGSGSARRVLAIVYGLYYDCGELLPSNFGATLGIRYTL